METYGENFSYQAKVQKWYMKTWILAFIQKTSEEYISQNQHLLGQYHEYRTNDALQELHGSGPFTIAQGTIDRKKNIAKKLETEIYLLK